MQVVVVPVARFSWGVDANCDVDKVLDQRGSQVRDLCCYQGLFPLFQSRWRLSWLSPDGSLRKKKVDLYSRIRSALRCQSLRTCICGAITNRCVFPGDVWKALCCWWVPVSLSQHHEFQNHIARHAVLCSTIGHIQRVLMSAMLRVSNETASL